MGRRSEHRLVLCAQAVGYGPVAKLLAIAEQLQPLGIRPTFLGTGMAHELASRSPHLGDAVEAGPSDPAAHKIVGAAWVVLSLMDLGYARLALRSSVPLHVADSLAWMRHPMPDEFLGADRYWVQDFPGLTERLCGISLRPTVVGPIVPPAAPPRSGGDPLLVVSLGGYETPYASHDDDSGYAEFVLTGLVESGVTSAFPGEAVVMAGARCAETLAARFTNEPLRFVSLRHEDAVALVATADLVLTAPGLTSTLECFRSGTPTFFLPPQNYSQWYILNRLRAGCLAPCSFHWTDHLPNCKVVEGMAPAQRIPAVCESIRACTGDEGARRCFRERMSLLRSWPKEKLADEQLTFFNSLGSNGAIAIASELGRTFRGTC